MSDDHSEPNSEQKKFLTKLFLGQNIGFRLGVADYDGFPDENIPEICFAGRSNVGKSSLINALTNRKNLARASNTPGRTQELNYFYVGSDDLHIVDLPGYGFAQAPKSKVDFWNKLIRDYLQGRQQLRRVYILIDARHGIKDNDKEIFTMLDKIGTSYQIIFTKIDKISETALAKTLTHNQDIVQSYIACHPRILTTSSEKKIGLDMLRHEIASFIPAYCHIGAQL
ncbi:MAG: ribosome biogenesis GTP-binding protein YihA/YsxC [Pseudomonadota bacterium]